MVLAGFMRVLKAPMLEAFPRRIINLHPSLLPKFPGREAWAQALTAGERVTGCTVHYVDAGVDSGEIIAQQEVAILPNDTPAILHERIQQAEREALSGRDRRTGGKDAGPQEINLARIFDRGLTIPASPAPGICPRAGQHRLGR